MEFSPRLEGFTLGNHQYKTEKWQCHEMDEGWRGPFALVHQSAQGKRKFHKKLQ
jgi:hypothetical protein